MDFTAQQLTEGLTLTPEERQGAIETIDAQLTQEKAFDILFGIAEATSKDIEEHKAEHGNKEPIPLVKMMWIARQAFIMGFAHGLDLYNDALKGSIADFFGGGHNKLTLYYYRHRQGFLTLQRGGRLLYV